MWKPLWPHAWVCLAPSDDDIPRELRTAGFVLVLGLRATSEPALGDLLGMLDACHRRTEAFCLASGGLYCAEADLCPAVRDDATVVDTSFPKGFHTEWHHLLADRPQLLREAQHTLLYTQWLIGALCIRLGDPPGVHVGDAALLNATAPLEKVPPLFHCMWQATACWPTMDAKQRRALRRTLRTAFHDDPFDSRSIRHLVPTTTRQP
jgi:hypothetical protein